MMEEVMGIVRMNMSLSQGLEKEKWWVCAIEGEVFLLLLFPKLKKNFFFSKNKQKKNKKNKNKKKIKKTKIKKN